MTPKFRILQAIATMNFYTTTSAKNAVATQAGCGSWDAVPDDCEVCREWARDLEAMNHKQRTAYIERRHDELIGRRRSKA